MNRFCRLKLNAKFSVKNRIVVPPMASGTADASGYATKETVAHYARLAASGAGLVIVEYSFVHGSGRSEPNQLAANSDANIEGLRKVARAIQHQGALAGLQLTHSGGKSDFEMTGGEIMGPSGIAVPVKGETLPTPRAMTAVDFQLWKASFGAAVDRALEAGFDLVEFHSAHGYGLNQLLSPVTNQRSDEYGTDRAKLLLEIVRSARARYPSLLLSVRIPGQDFLPGGLTLGDSIKLAHSLERSGVNIINVSSGIGGWRRPSTREGEGYLVGEAAAIQGQVSIPVIGVGGIETGEYIDLALSEKKFSLAAVGRAILKNPEAWGQNQLSKEIRKRLCFELSPARV